MKRFNVMTAIPYVNGRPHVGHALELVQADVLARHRRRGQPVRFQTGTDDNALKNVRVPKPKAWRRPSTWPGGAARSPTSARRSTSPFDDFIRTSSDPRHAAGSGAALVRLRGQRRPLPQELLRAVLRGLRALLRPRRAHRRRPLPRTRRRPGAGREENWFFRLSRYEDQLRRTIASGRLRIEPAEPATRGARVHPSRARRLQRLAQRRARARLGHPGARRPDQVIYVWFDALANYITAPGYGTDDADFHRWWDGSERVHVIGKGIIRFHAVYWPAMLLSAGLSLPDTRSSYTSTSPPAARRSASRPATPTTRPTSSPGTAATPCAGGCSSEVGRAGDTDFTIARMVAGPTRTWPTRSATW